MATTCGYLCPQCEGRGFKENGEDCDWCSIDHIKSNSVLDNSTENDVAEWIEKVHNSACCGDWEQK
ncbi:MAG: hypothetical protein U0V72_03275 [Cytophagales bacterium]